MDLAHSQDLKHKRPATDLGSPLNPILEIEHSLDLYRAVKAVDGPSALNPGANVLRSHSLRAVSLVMISSAFRTFRHTLFHLVGPFQVKV